MSKSGTLFYVIGASGAGKDTLIRWVREHLSADARVVFAHRYITRSVEATGENHISLTEREFDRLLRIGCFAMHWRSHGLSYGIGVEVSQWLEMGLSVVVNGSRAYLDEAVEQYPELVPVLITASTEVIRERLIHRARETIEQIEHRLQRGRELDKPIEHPNLITIDNNGAVEEAGPKLLSLISS